MADSLVSPVAASAPAQAAFAPAHPHLKSLVDAAMACGPLHVVIAYPSDAASLDAAALCKMADRGQITGAVLVTARASGRGAWA